MTHNSFCVNLSAIANRSATEVVLKNGETVPVSDSHRESFGGRYLAYIKNKRNRAEYQKAALRLKAHGRGVLHAARQSF